MYSYKKIGTNSYICYANLKIKKLLKTILKLLNVFLVATNLQYITIDVKF